jgi:hypothetical protein
MFFVPTNHSAHRNASYVTAPCLGFPRQHSGERECDCDYNSDLVHMNLPIWVATSNA